MGVDTIIRIILGIIVFTFLITNFLQITFFLGIIFGLLSSVFMVFQYIGTSCDLILNVRALFYTAICFFLGFQYWKLFLHR